MRFLAHFAHSMAIGKNRMTEVRSRIKSSMTTAQLRELAPEHGLGPRTLHSETKLTYLAEARSFGRHACKVELEAGVVMRAAYSYAD